MSFIQSSISEPDYQRIMAVLCRMQQELDADLVLLIHRSGQHIASDGPAQDLDLTALSSLAAASLAATDGLARLVGEREFSVLFQQGRRRSIHISSVDEQFCLVLIFGETVSGLVRWKVRRSSGALAQALQELQQRSVRRDTASDMPGEKPAVRYFSDEELDKLFGQ